MLDAERDAHAIRARMRAYSSAVLKFLKERRELIAHEMIIKELVNANDKYTLAEIVLDYTLPVLTRIRAIEGLKEIGATHLRDALKSKINSRIVALEHVHAGWSYPGTQEIPQFSVSIEKLVLSKIDEILTPG